MRELILAYQGEMALKGLNRATFESILVKTMRRRLKLSLIHISEPTRP